MSNVTANNYLPELKTTQPYDDDGLVATLINELVEGRTNACGTLTLAANVASTTFADPNFNGVQYILLVPLTANAAAELGAGTLYQDTTGSLSGQFKLVHANNAQTDRNFAYLRFG